MKIAIFTDTYAPDVNGVAKTLERYTEYLEKNRIEYRIFAPKAKKETANGRQFIPSKSIPLLFYPELRVAFPNRKKIQEELLDFEPDIIHVTTPFSMGLVGRHLARKLVIPVVGSYHTDFDKYLEHYHLQFLSSFYWEYCEWFHRPLEKIFVPSQDTKERLEKREFHHLEIWPRGIDGTLFHRNYETEKVRAKYGITEKYILLYVGRIASEKDIKLLPKIAAQLPDEIGNNVHWLVVGDGPKRKKLEIAAPANMTLAGYAEGEDLATVYAAADLFVSPSASETFGNVVLESLACGTPVIGANSGGVKTIVEHEQTGLLSEEKNAFDFARNIIHLLKDDELRVEMSEKGYNYAQSQSWDTIFENLLREYNEVLETISYNEKELV